MSEKPSPQKKFMPSLSIERFFKGLKEKRSSDGPFFDRLESRRTAPAFQPCTVWLSVNKLVGNLFETGAGNLASARKNILCKRYRGCATLCCYPAMGMARINELKH
jgi:hypothetical protein